jgi:hypothetical protein
VRSDKESVTLVTEVTPYRGVYRKNILDMLESLNEEKEGRHTLPQTVTSVTSVTRIGDYHIIPAYPAIGILYEINGFLSGHIRVRGRANGSYPFNYLEMLDHVFGAEDNKDTIEVCSGSVKGCFTVDINQECYPDLVADGQQLTEIPDNSFSRYRCDPPYNAKTAKEMYGTDCPKLGKLLFEGARVVKPGSLMFLLCSQNVQSGTIGKGNIKRIGFIYISVIPTNETRILNIYVKLEDPITK